MFCLLAASYSPAKQTLINRVKNSLIASGYIDKPKAKNRFVAKLRKLTQRETTWNPDICLSHKGKHLLVADVQLLENRRFQYIPSPMEHIAPIISANFPFVQIALFVPLGSNIKASAILSAVKSRITVEAIDQNGNLHEILDPLKTCKISETTTDQNLAINRQVNSGWFIPVVLVNRLLRVRKLEYSKDSGNLPENSH